MRKIMFFMRVLLLVTVALLGLNKLAYAEQVNKSVKECLENPDACNQNQPTTENDNTNTNTTDNNNVGLTIWDFLKMIFATIFVVALLYFMLKFINKKNKSYKSSQIIENIGGASLGSNRSVQIIKVGNQLLVVGVGESIQLLKEINDEEEYRQILSNYNDKMEQLVQPSDIVTKVLERAKIKKKKSTTEESQFSTILKNQLQDMKNNRKKIFEDMEKKGPEDR
ncbi:flagellar biosynthetic protein FliO [Bacillus massilinigeriensis]|uniref:flagellar biosynthetic protein FliO n=1 Tax=Bacillus massilionigeriensis TaxID=1805475 RepID=UPI000A444A4B|nr:flagellar biosynthetic protein FliO [Bacillus massilionigeriensis]